MDLVEHYRREMTLRYLPVRYEDVIADQIMVLLSGAELPEDDHSHRARTGLAGVVIRVSVSAEPQCGHCTGARPTTALPWPRSLTRVSMSMSNIDGRGARRAVTSAQ